MTDQLVSHPPLRGNLLTSPKESEHAVLASVNRCITFPTLATNTQLAVGDNAGEITQTRIARPAATPEPLDPAVLSLALKSGHHVKIIRYDASHCLLAITFDSKIQIWLGSLTQEHGREWALYDRLSCIHNGAVLTCGFSILVWPLSAMGEASKHQQIFKIPALTGTQVAKADSVPVDSFSPKFIVTTDEMLYLTSIEGHIQHALPVFKIPVGSFNSAFIVIANPAGKLYLVSTEGHMQHAVPVGGNCLVQACGFTVECANHTGTARIHGAATGDHLTNTPVERQAPSSPTKAALFTISQMWKDKDGMFSYFWAHDKLKLGVVLVLALVIDLTIYALMVAFLIWGYFWLFLSLTWRRLVYVG
ncbi:hypothetical protein FS749_006568 [Ceratobasidium sp. UAMH 11750]|nr:hypothetical protein FS749_006568 [Ceratobasidium sp. UAMH 11750]